MADHDAPANKPQADAPKRDQYYKDWERRAAAALAKEGITDWSQLKPSDIAVQFGKPLTAEQFAEYRKHRHVQILGSGKQP